MRAYFFAMLFVSVTTFGCKDRNASEFNLSSDTTLGVSSMPLESFVKSVTLDDYNEDELKPYVELFHRQKNESDWAGACDTYGGYLKKRLHKRWPQPMPDSVTARSDGWDRLLKNEVYFSGNWIPLGEPIPWNDSSHGIEFLAKLHRHDYVAELASIYRISKNEIYAQKAITVITDWLAKAGTPPTPETTYEPFWDGLNTSIRMGVNWPNILTDLRQSESLSDRFVCHLAKSAEVHMQIMVENRSSLGNVGMFQREGMAYATLLLAEHNEFPRWTRINQDRLLSQVKRDFYPDGSEVELAFSYGVGALGNVVEIEKLYRHNPDTPQMPADFISLLESAYHYTLYSLSPTKRMPPVNDGANGVPAGTIRTAAELFPKRPDFQWFNNASGVVPQITSLMFPYSGQYVLRSGWDRNHNYMFFEAGLYGAYHQHEDKLSFILSAFGEDMIVEGGNYFPYGPYPQRRYVTSTFAHNTIAVDRKGQNRAKLGRTSSQWRHLYPYDHPLKNPWISNSAFDYAAGTYEDGFGHVEPSSQVVHRRSVIFIKPKLYVIIDRLIPNDAYSHLYEAFLHLGLETIGWQIENRQLTASNPGNGNNIRITTKASTAVEMSVVKDRAEKSEQIRSDTLMQGYGVVAGRHLAPVPTVVTTFSGRGAAFLVTVLETGSAQTTYQLNDFEAQMNKELMHIELNFADGSTYSLTEQYDGKIGKIELTSE